MRHKGVRKKFLSRVLGLFLAVTILCSAFLFGENAAATVAVVPASAENFEVFSQVADPITNRPVDMGFSDIPLVHDGRIWTDKTVVDLTPDAVTDEFDVTFSALSQSFSIVAGYAIPSDIVIIIDVSGSMAQNTVPYTDNLYPGPGGLSRIAVLSDALNEALDILMSANPLNRVAVVAYGGLRYGYARVEHVLELGRYVPDGNGNFFEVRDRGEWDDVEGTVMYVRAQIEAGDTDGRVVTRNLPVVGSTPTQWGIYEGARILTERNNAVGAGDIVVEVPRYNDQGEFQDNVTVTRRPNIILMTDGEPTMGWPNWTFDPNITTYGLNPLRPPTINSSLLDRNNGRFYGDGSHGEMGLAILTVLTAAYMKRAVHNRYFPDGNYQGDAPSQPPARVGFYNISLGTDRAIVNATMNPERDGDIPPTDVDWDGNTSGTNPDTIVGGDQRNMRLRLQEFVNPTSMSTRFHALYRYAFGNYQWEAANSLSLVTVTNPETNPLAEADLWYNDDYFSANDVGALADAFEEIAGSIQATSLFYTSTEDHGDPDHDGWLVFTDVLGEYMEFRGSPRLSFPTFNGGSDVTVTPVDITDLAQVDLLVDVLEEHFNFGTPDAMDEIRVRALVQASAGADLTESIRYFADRNRNWVADYIADFDPTTDTPPGNAAALVEIFPMMGIGQTLLGSTDLLNIAFHVVTVLDGGTFTEIRDIPDGTINRILATGDQLIRWYIPASLIPMRNIVVPDVTPPSPPPPVSVEGNVDPIQVTFTVGLNWERLSEPGFAAYQTANIDADGRLHFYTNRWQLNQDNNVSLAFYQPHPDNPFYEDNQPGWVEARRGAIMKQANPTATRPHVSMFVSFDHRDGTDDIRTDVHFLGNNGRLTLQRLGELEIIKQFRLDGAPWVPNRDLQDIMFMITGPDPSLESITVVYPSDFIITNGVGVLSRNLTPGTYTVVKDGGEPSPPNEPPLIYVPTPQTQTVVVRSSQTASLTFRNEYFTPTPIAYTPALRVKKYFHGIMEADIPQNFQITINATTTNNARPNAHLGWEQVGGNWRLVLDLAQSEAGIHLQELAEGTYTITESNLDATGWYGPDIAWLWRDGVNVLLNTDTDNATIDNIVLGTNSDVVARFHNTYTPTGITPPRPPRPPVTPPTTPPDPPGVVLPAIPPTGDDAQMGVYVAIMVLSLLFIAGTVVVFVRFRRKEN